MSDSKEERRCLNEESCTGIGDSLECEDNMSNISRPLEEEGSIEETLPIKNEGLADSTVCALDSTCSESERGLSIETRVDSLNIERSINFDDQTKRTRELVHFPDDTFSPASTEQKPEESGDSEKRTSLARANEIHLAGNESDLSERLEADLMVLDSSSSDSPKTQTVARLNEDVSDNIFSRQKDLLIFEETTVLNEKNYAQLFTDGEEKRVAVDDQPLSIIQEKSMKESLQTLDSYSLSKDSCLEGVDADNKINDEKRYSEFAKKAYCAFERNLPAMITPLKHCESFPALEEGNLDNEIRLFGHKLNPIFRLSLKLSPYLPASCEIPNADSHRQYEKAGYLQKLSGRGFPYLHQWKRRYCVLHKGCLFLYEKDSSKGTDKASSVVDLKYFDHVAEALQKEAKKASNVFVVTSQDRSFFDPGRHLFAADTLTEMHDWIHKLRESIELIRNNNRPSVAKQGKAKERELRALLKENLQEQKSKEPSLRKEQPVVPQPEDAVDASTHKGGILKADFASRLEKKLKIETDCEKSHSKLGVQEESKETEVDSSSHTASVPDEPRKSVSTKIVLQLPNLESKPQLESITKYRTKGPLGRRAPQTRRATHMKHRASSMSALQAEGNSDTEARSGSSQGFRSSTLTADGLSLAENPSQLLDIENPPYLNDGSKSYLNNSEMSFDDIEDALFFKSPSPLRYDPENSSKPVVNGKKRKSLFNFKNVKISKTNPDKNIPKEKSNSLFRNATFKINAFRTSGSPTSDHPETVNRTKRCMIL